MSDPIYTIQQGVSRNLVVEVPHRGRQVPVSLRHHQTLIRAAAARWDNYIDAAGEYLNKSIGGILIGSIYSRLVVDLNRGADRIDARLCARWPGARRYEDGGAIVPFTRINGAMSLLYERPVEPEEIAFRLNEFWYPYHETLRARIAKTIQNYGHCVLISLHSAEPESPHAHLEQPVMYLGTHHGRSCDPTVLRAVQRTLEKHGIEPVTQGVYQGAFTTQAYADDPRVQAIQIELDRRFLDRETPAAGRNTQLKALRDALLAVTRGETCVPDPRGRTHATTRVYYDPLTGEVNPY